MPDIESPIPSSSASPAAAAAAAPDLRLRRALPALVSACARALGAATLASVASLATFAATAPLADARAATHCRPADGGPPCPAAAGIASLALGDGPDAGVGNPINPLTGNKYQEEVDAEAMSDPAGLGIEIRRHYNAAHVAAPAPAGRGWQLSYDTWVHDAPGLLQVVQADGRRLLFRAGDGADAAASDCAGESPDHGRLQRLQPGYRWHWPDGRRLDFDRDGRLVQVAVPSRGAVLRIARDAHGRLRRVTDPQGRSLELHHDAHGHLERVVHPDGEWRYRIDEEGRVREVRAPDGASRLYRYDDPAHRARFTELRTRAPDGSERLAGRWRFDPDGRAIAHERADGSSVAVTYVGGFEPGTTATTRTAWVDDSRRGRSIYTGAIVAGQWRVVAVDGPGCADCGPAPLRVVYDRDGRLRERGSADRATGLRIERDALGRIQRLVALGPAPGAERVLARYGYDEPADPAARPRFVARPSVEPGREYRLDILPADRGPVPGAGSSARGPLGTGIAPWPRLIVESGYSAGRPIRRAYRIDFDAAGLPVRLEGPLVARRPDDPATERLVDADWIAGPGTRAHPIARDANGRPTGLIDPAAPSDGSAAGDAAAVAIRRLARLLGMLRLATPGLAPGIEPGIDPVADPFVDPSFVAGFEIADDHLAHRKRGGAAQRIDVDDFGRVIRIASADAGVEILEYDGHDRLLRQRDETGASIEMTYDEASGARVARRLRLPDGTETLTRYDHADGRLVAIRHPVADERFVYDARQRVVERTIDIHPIGAPIAGDATAIGAARAAAPRRLTTRYHYAGESRAPVAIERPGFGLLPTGEDEAALTWRHHPWLAPLPLLAREAPAPDRIAGARQVWRYGNGTEVERQVDARGRLSVLVHRGAGGTLHEARLDYADPRHPLKLARISGAGRQTGFAYDAAGRLIVAETRATSDAIADPAAATGTASFPVWRYRYDADGNRIARQAGGQTERIAYEPASHRPQGQPHDGRGHPLRLAGRPLTWHPAGLLLQVGDAAAPLARYHHDHRGERVVKQTRDATHFYVHENGRVAYELTVPNDPRAPVRARAYVYRGLTPVAFIDRLGEGAHDGAVDAATSSGLAAVRSAWRRHWSTLRALPAAWLAPLDPVTFVHGNYLGAPVVATDHRARVIWRASYSPDGERTATPDPDFIPIALPGQYRDPETGLHYNRHRHYDPVAGRYLSPDPLGLWGGSDPYLYAGGDPVSQVDPTGLLLFAFDGTWNTPSDRTNVRQFASLYAQVQDGERLPAGVQPVAYENGVGTQGGRLRRLVDGATGNGWSAIVDQQVDRLVRASAALMPGETLFVDVVGFSRGAAQARVFGEIVANALRTGALQTPGRIELRFMGLFDTVSTGMFGDAGAADLDCRYRIAPEWRRVTHLVAAGERRVAFALDPLGVPAGRRGAREEIALLGAHADIGGGYDGIDTPAAMRGDLSEVALWVMVERARLAGVRLEPFAASQARVTTPIVHDESTLPPATPRAVNASDGWTTLSDAGIAGIGRGDAARLVAPATPSPRVDPDRPASTEAANVAGFVDMAAYCNWLVTNGILSSCNA